MKIWILQPDLQPLASFCKWDLNPSCKDSNPSCVNHIFRFLVSNCYVGDSNPTSFSFTCFSWGIESFLQGFESIAFDSFTFSFRIRIYPMEIRIHVVQANLLESRLESVAWGFECTSSSRSSWPFMEFRFKSILWGFESWSSGKLTEIQIRIHSIRIWISFFRFPSLHFLELGFKSTSAF